MTSRWRMAAVTTMVCSGLLTGAGNIKSAQAETDEAWCAWLCAGGTVLCCIVLPEACELCLEGGFQCIEYCLEHAQQQ